MTIYIYIPTRIKTQKSIIWTRTKLNLTIQSNNKIDFWKSIPKIGHEEFNAFIINGQHMKSML